MAVREAQSLAETGHLTIRAQLVPLENVVHFALKCNTGLCGIKKTEFIHKRRRETRTHAGGHTETTTREVSALYSE